MFSPLKPKKSNFLEINNKFNQFSSTISVININKEKQNDVDNLHNKLKSETERMLRWKISTELSLHQKDHQLEESKKLLYSLRKNLLDQQLSSEQLSQTVFKERNHREQMQDKVETTRLLCSALKQNQQELQIEVFNFIEIKDNLLQIQESSLIDVKDLIKKFKVLSSKHKAFVDDLTQKATQEISSLKEERCLLKEDLDKKKNTIQDLADENGTTKKIIDENETQINSLQKFLDDVTVLKNKLEEELNNTKLMLSEVERDLKMKIEESGNEIIDLKVTLASEKKLLNESKCEFEEAVGKIQYLKKCNDKLEGCNQEYTEQLKILKQKKGQVEQELAHTSEKFEDFSNKVSNSETVLKGQISYLEEKINELNLNIEAERTEKVNLIVLQKNIEEQFTSEKLISKEKEFSISNNLAEKETQMNIVKAKNDEFVNQIKDLEMTMKSKCDLIVNLDNIIEKVKLEIEDLDVALKKKEDEVIVSQKNNEKQINLIEEFRLKVVALENDKEKLTDSLSQVKSEYEEEKRLLLTQVDALELQHRNMVDTASNNSSVVKTLLQKIQNLEDTKIQEQSSMREELLSAKSAAEGFASENLSLKEQIEDERKGLAEQTKLSTESRNEISSLSESYESLVKKNENLNIESEAQKSTIKETENELKSTKNSLNLELKKSDKLKTKIDNLCEKLKNKEIESKLSQSELNQEIESLHLKNKEVEQVLETTKIELLESEKCLEECKLESESKIKEMMSLMDSYKKDKESEFTAKEMQLDDIKEELSDLQQILNQKQHIEDEFIKDKQNIETNLKTLEKENIMLEQNLSDKVREIEKFKGALNMLSSNSTQREIPTPKTPTPSDYLPLLRGHGNIRKTPLAENRNGVSSHRERRVSFSTAVSALSYQNLDSDSSIDALHVEVGSDTDDKFDSVCRSTLTRKQASPRTPIPQANIQPMIRQPPVKVKSFRTPPTNPLPMSKKVCFERTSQKSYRSPKASVEKVIGQRTASRSEYQF